MGRLRQFSLLVVAAALMAVGAQLVACGDGQPGGGEPLSLQEYLQRMDAVREEMRDRSFALDDKYSEQLDAASSDEEYLDAYRRGLGEQISVESDHLDDIKSLAPPPEAEALHQAYVDAQAEGVEFLTDFDDRMDGVDSRSEVDELWDEAGGGFDEISQRITRACSGLQDLADENDIDVNLEC